MKKCFSHSLGRLLSALALLCASIAPVRASCVLDGNFYAGGNLTWGGQYILAVATQSDGKVLYGGYFTIEQNGVYYGNIIRFNTDGSIDTSFNPSPDHAVSTILVQPDQKIIIGGHFSTVMGYSKPYLARLHSSGYPGYPDGFPASAPNGPVYSLGRFSDGRIITGGFFTTVGSSPSTRVACFQPNGAHITTFNPGIVGNAVWAIAVYPPGVPSADKVMIGGNFSQVASYNRVNLARLLTSGAIDTSFDTSFNPVNGIVYALGTDYATFDAYGSEWQEKVYIGGAFTSPRTYFTRLAHSGGMDSNIEGSTTDGTVRAIRVQANHGVLLAGDFAHAPHPERVRRGVARFFPGALEDGSHINDVLGLSSWSDCGGCNVGGTVNALALAPSGEIYIGGGFTGFENTSWPHFARLFPNW